MKEERDFEATERFRTGLTLLAMAQRPISRCATAVYIDMEKICKGCRCRSRVCKCLCADIFEKLAVWEIFCVFFLCLLVLKNWQFWRTG